MRADEFMTKALTLVGGADGFTGTDIALAEARLGRGLAPQPDLAAAVAALA